MTNLDTIWKSRGITLPTKVHLVKAMVYPVAVYGCESWTFAFNFPSFSEEERRESWKLKNWCLWTVVLEKTLNGPLQFSHSVVSDSLRPHEPQHARPPCPSPTPRVHPNPCTLSRWCHPTILSSVVPFSFCPQSFPGSGSFPMSQLFNEVAKVLEFQL